VSFSGPLLFPCVFVPGRRTLCSALRRGRSSGVAVATGRTRCGLHGYYTVSHNLACDDYNDQLKG